VNGHDSYGKPYATRGRAYFGRKRRLALNGLTINRHIDDLSSSFLNERNQIAEIREKLKNKSGTVFI